MFKFTAWLCQIIQFWNMSMWALVDGGNITLLGKSGARLVSMSGSLAKKKMFQFFVLCPLILISALMNWIKHLIISQTWIIIVKRIDHQHAMMRLLSTKGQRLDVWVMYKKLNNGVTLKKEELFIVFNSSFKIVFYS